MRKGLVIMSNHNIDKLSIIWDKRQKDFVFKYPRRCDGALIVNYILSNILEHDMNSKKEYPFNFKTFCLKDELELRGYDLTTLKFSIELKKENSIKDK